MDITKVLDSLLTVEFFELKLTAELLSTATDKNSVKKLLEVSKNIGDDYYIPFRKFYSISVKAEELLNEENQAQINAAETLKRLASKIAQKQDKSVLEVENTFKDMIANGINYENMPLELIPVYQNVLLCIRTINNQDSNNLKIVNKAIQERVVDSDLKPLLPNWKIEDTAGLGENFINTVILEYILNEQRKWKRTELDEDNWGESGKESNEFNTEQKESVTTKSIKTLSSGK